MQRTEIEVKILEINVADITNKLISIGARELFRGLIVSHFFRNNVGQKIRLRLKDGKHTLTYKIQHPHEHFLQADELELEISNYETMATLLKHIGFTHYGQSEKYRISYDYKGIQFDIDQISEIPPFLEIEAHTQAEVKTGVELLGYTMADTCTLTERLLKEHYNK